MKRFKKPIIILIIVILALSLTQSILVFTGVFNRIVRENLERVFSKALNGSCHISDIKGKWNYYEISGVEIRSDNLDADILRGEIEINLAAVLIKKININRIFLDSANIYIKKSAPDTSLKPDTTASKSIQKIIENIPFSINAPEITLKKINLHFDTLYAEDIELNAVLSLNKKRGYLLYRIENCDLNGYANLKGSRGEIGFKTDSLFHKGVIATDVFTIDNSIGLKNDTLFIDEINMKMKAENYPLLKHFYTLLGNIKIKGRISKEFQDISLEADFKRAGMDSMFFNKIKLSSVWKEDTIKIKSLECSDSTFPFSSSGFAELSPKLNTELNIALKGVKAEHFIKNAEIKENSIYGVMHLKTNMKDAATLVLDSLYGFYGNIKNIKASGSASYIDSELSIKNIILKIEDGELSADGNISSKKGMIDLKVSDFPLEILTSLKNDISVLGQANGEMKIEGGARDYRFSYNLEVTNAYYEKNTFEYFSSSGSLNGSGLNIQKGVIQGSFINGTVFGKNVSIVYFEALKDIDDIYVDIDGVSEILSFGLSGKIKANKDFSEAQGQISRFDIKTDIDEFSLNNPAYIGFSGKSVYADSFNLSGSDGFIKGNFGMSADSLKFKIDCYDKNLSITRYISGVDLKGDAEFSAMGEGPKNSIRMKFNTAVRHFKYGGINVDSLFLNCDYDGENLDINYLNAFQNDKLSYIYGRIEIDEKKLEESKIDIEFNLKNIDEKYFAPLENVFTMKTESGLKAEGRLTGTVSDPKMDGNLILDSTDVYIVSLGTTVKAAKGEVVLRGDSAIVTALKGKTEKGEVYLTGGASLKKYIMQEYWFDIEATGVHSIGIDYVDVFANCSLDIRGNMKKVDLNGLIKITEGVSNFPFVSSSDGSQSGGVSKYTTNMNLRLINDNNLWLKNNFVDVELKGDVNLKRQGKKFNITGQANVIRGYYFYLDKKFNVESGVFELKETNKTVEPTINITSSTNIQYIDGEDKKQAKIYLEVSGSAFKPTLTLYSEPAMGIENIISVLSFNTTVASLNNFEEISKGVPEKALQIYLRNKYLNTISSSIGVDQLDIETSLLSLEKSAKLSVGKYIGRKLYVSYTHDVFTFQKDVFRIEYNVIKNTDIITERDADGYFNTGLQFKYRF